MAAIWAAARLRTPALQKKTTSRSRGGFAKPNRSSKSSALSSSASGCEVMGRLSAVGRLLAVYSCGSRTSMRSGEAREVEGLERRERICFEEGRWSVCLSTG